MYIEHTCGELWSRRSNDDIVCVMNRSEIHLTELYLRILTSFFPSIKFIYLTISILNKPKNHKMSVNQPDALFSINLFQQ